MIEQHGTLEISRSRLQHNLTLLRSQLGTTQICATLKANAYGHGAPLIANLIRQSNIPWAAVYSLEEALNLAPNPVSPIKLPTLSPATKILVLAPTVIHSPETVPSDIFDAARAHIRLNIIDALTAKSLSTALHDSNLPPLNIHLQIDTGLTRSGIAPELAESLADEIANLPNLHLDALFAHFSHADIPNHPATLDQAQRFHQIAAPIKQKHPHILTHLQNSGATFRPPANSQLDVAPPDFARIGIALYGLQPSTAHPIPNLLPIARLTAPILTIHEVPENTGVGYGHTFTTTRPSRLAIVPAGYAEGYPRALSNNSVAQLHNHNIPLIARISMDQTILDITDHPTAKPGDRITLISWDPAQPNSIDKIADSAGTIGYEIATHLGSRLHRAIVD